MLQRNFERGDPLGLAAEPDKIVAEMNMIMSRVTELSDMVENELNYLRAKTFHFVETDIWDILMEARAAMEYDLEALGVKVAEYASETRRPVMADPGEDARRLCEPDTQRGAGDAERRQPAPQLQRTAPANRNGERRGHPARECRRSRWSRRLTRFSPPKRRGWGWGWVTVKRIVETHRGKVTAVSVEGQGTSFEVALPAAR